MAYFITGNKNKLAEVKSILGESISSISLDLPEIQELDPKLVIAAKLQEAIKATDKRPLFCEDTSVYIDALQGFPGPLIKWFLESLGDKGIADLVAKYDDQKATVKTVVGFVNEQDEISFFEGALQGTIVQPVVDSAFGWDPIFKPEGVEKTFAEMTKEEKNEISMRRLAFEQIKPLLK